MGSVYAGLLADAGHEVWAIDLWREHVDAIERDGLRVEGASGDRVAMLRASVRADDAGVCDLVVLATKAADVAAAAASARPLIGPNTEVLAIQNGLGSADRVSAVLGYERVLVGIAGGFGASIVGPGHVHHNGWNLLGLGELSGRVTSQLRQVAAIWADAGFSVRTYEDINRMIWEKFICNVCFSGTCAVTGLTIGEVIGDQDAWGVASDARSRRGRSPSPWASPSTSRNLWPTSGSSGSRFQRPGLLCCLTCSRPTHRDRRAQWRGSGACRQR